MTTNPYEPPSSSLENGGNILGRRATKWRRFTNFAIDYFVIVAVWFFILLFTESLWLEFRRYDFHTEQPPIFPPPYDKNISAAIATVLASVFALLYFIFTEWTTGKTIGKLLTGTVVVDRLGRPASFRHLLKRTVLRFVPWDCLTYLVGNKPGWHDRFSATEVIHRKREVAE